MIVFSKAKDNLYACLASAYLRLSSIFVIIWLADLLYLPRLFVYYCQMGFESSAAQRLKNSPTQGVHYEHCF